MRAVLTRALVEALGERGKISLDLVPQLLPVLDIGSMPQLGSPVGIPLATVKTVTAVAAQRSGVFFSAPEGYVIRIDRVRTTAFDAFLAWGPVGSSINENYTIIDWRRRSTGGAFTNLRGIATTNADLATWAAGIGLTNIAVLAAGVYWHGPVYVTAGGSLAMYHTVDNQAGTFEVYAEAFELG